MAEQLECLGLQLNILRKEVTMLLIGWLGFFSYSLNDLLVRIFNECIAYGEVPEDWQISYIVPFFKGKG